MTTLHDAPPVNVAQTAEGGQEMTGRDVLAAAERLRQGGAVLRLSEAEAVALDSEATPDDETMLINMGPQHPSTHGVLRLMLELKGETVQRCKPIIGYLHTGMERTGEELTYLQGPTNVTRMDYAAPLFTELAFSLTVERLLDIEVPERAVWIRMLMTEMNRISSHLLFVATNGMDLGAVSMLLYGWREREETLRFLQEVTGLRMNHNYIRPGGVAADLPDGWRHGVLRLLDMLPERLGEYETLMNNQPIWRERLQGVGVITTEECMALGVTGPILRSTGYAWDLRRETPYLAYDEVDFDVVVGTYGDCYDRYAIRLAEIRESMAAAIADQALRDAATRQQIADVKPILSFFEQSQVPGLSDFPAKRGGSGLSEFPQRGGSGLPEFPQRSGSGPIEPAPDFFQVQESGIPDFLKDLDDA